MKIATIKEKRETKKEQNNPFAIIDIPINVYPKERKFEDIFTKIF